LKSKGQKGQWYLEKNVKIVFREYLCQMWINLRHTKTRMINGQFYTVSQKMHEL